jgi:hypothetical protein
MKWTTKNYSDSGPQHFKTVVSLTPVPTSLCFRIYYRDPLHLKFEKRWGEYRYVPYTVYQKLNFLLMAKPGSGSGSARTALIYLSRSGSALRQKSWILIHTKHQCSGSGAFFTPGSGIRYEEKNPDTG